MTIQKWDEDPQFQRIWADVRERTLVDKVRCYMLYQFALQCPDGRVAELGVYKGGTAQILAEVMKTRGSMSCIHLFDTFTGMPDADPKKDLHKKGDFNDVSAEEVRRHLSRFTFVWVFEGLFPATAKPVDHLSFSLVHIDADIYTSVMEGCRFFYPRMVRGGVMVFDDYGFESCPGARQAVDEFFEERPDRPIYLPTGQCVVIKSN